MARKARLCTSSPTSCRTNYGLGSLRKGGGEVGRCGHEAEVSKEAMHWWRCCGLADLPGLPGFGGQR